MRSEDQSPCPQSSGFVPGGTGRLSRFVAAGLALAVGLILGVGCRDGGAEARGVADELGVAADEGASARPLRIYSWEDYLAPAVLEGFTAETGVEFELHSYETSEEMLSVLETGREQFDIVILESVDAPILVEQGLVEALDYGQLPEAEGLGASFRWDDGDVRRSHSVPYLWGTTVVAYRESLAGPATGSWGMIFEAGGRYPVVLLSEVADTWAAAMHHVGREDWDDVGLEAAAGALHSLVSANDVVLTSDTGAVELLQSGKIGAALVYSGDASVLAEEDEDVDYFIPDEGAQLWTDVLTICSGTPRSETAHRFLNYLMRPEVSAETANDMAYATPIDEALKFVDPELLADPRIYPSDGILERCREVPIMDRKQMATLSRLAGRFLRAIERRKDENREGAQFSGN